MRNFFANEAVFLYLAQPKAIGNDAKSWDKKKENVWKEWHEMKNNDSIDIGYIGRPHGIRGDVVVMTFNPDSDLLTNVSAVTLSGKVSKQLEIRSVSPLNKGWRVRFKGVDDRNAAEALKGATVHVERSLFPDLPPGENYITDLIGLDVIDADSGDCLGKLARVWETGAHDCYVVNDSRGEILLPAIADVILEVNLTERTMRVRPPEGLLELYRNDETET